MVTAFLCTFQSGIICLYALLTSKLIWCGSGSAPHFPFTVTCASIKGAPGVGVWGTYKGWCEGRGCPVWSAGACDPTSPSGTADWGSDGGPCSILYLQQQQQKQGVLMLHAIASRQGLTSDPFPIFDTNWSILNSPFSGVWLGALQAHENVTQESFCIYIIPHRNPENHFHLFRSLLAHRYTLTGNLVCLNRYHEKKYFPSIRYAFIAEWAHNT